jgi:outer membrane immunogenic protein
MRGNGISRGMGTAAALALLVVGSISSAEAKECWRSVFTQKVYTNRELGELATSMGSDLLKPESSYVRFIGETKFTPVPCPPPAKPEIPWAWAGWYVGMVFGVSVLNGTWPTTELTSLGIRDPLVDDLKSLYKVDPFMAVSIGFFENYFQRTHTLFSNILFGEELYVDYIRAAIDPGIPGTGAIASAAVRANDSVIVRANWSIAVRSRLGYLITPSTLLYIAAGPAWLNMAATVNCTAAGVCGTNGIPPFAQTNSTMKLGWTLGTGIETQLWDRWRGRVEYKYADYGTFSTSFGTPNNLALAADIKMHIQSAMVGLSYAFAPSSSPVLPAYPVKALPSK